VSFPELESRIGYTFGDPDLLRRSLTHPSLLQENDEKEHNQRLEFLGDAVLGMVIAELLFSTFPEEREGHLTRARSILVRGRQLASLAREIDLNQHLRVSEAEEAAGGRERESILEDAFEALIGAVYLDGGLPAARSVVQQVYGSLTDRLEMAEAGINPKGRLQERLQPEVPSEAIDYRVVDASGPDHRKSFTIELWILERLAGRGQGPSKKAAEEAAAAEALVYFDENGLFPEKEPEAE
jgi:ribonuclease-3